ncbi:ribbon-helix-helix protein, CopG family [Oerskovia flava]|uniref:ribbon-helix-helix protein, CopG family n=1 Tax=Oerskovia flava TaxID=2986422 RepID=UPI00223EBAAB|nr:ribbon-helix-helix protein, CopG family [Oerskovia sp. JB1-3-2]
MGSNQLVVRFDEEEKRVLEQAAEREGRSQNEIVREAVRRYVADRTALRDRLIADAIRDYGPVLDRLA